MLNSLIGSGTVASRDITHCVFCDVRLVRANRTSEHVLPKWLRKVPLVEATFTVPPNSGQRRIIGGRSLHIGSTFIGIDGQEEQSRSKFEHPFYGTVPVCKACNTGWMAQLETVAKVELGPLFNGTTDAILAPQIASARRWATKTSIVAELDDPARRTFGRAQRRDVLLGRRARWTEVFVAQFDEPRFPNMIHRPLRIVSEDGTSALAASTIIAAGRLAMLTVNCSIAPQQLARNGLGAPNGWVRLVDGETATLAPEGFTNNDFRRQLSLIDQSTLFIG